ncbi:heavy metal translocating P-type ATPase [Spirosoma sp. BT702]|uniref:P-type Zn(2+) transporter n=1 Tax=Spirosoma profusum TaxID=2771354 RepID=A0A927AN71_9BACT|nr:heavy metal translocating P-type ATPase [Spirosoma profusum]MBD2701249.1 heavy metal translocating P-type ATPase [Spirosoma profusum]
MEKLQIDLPVLLPDLPDEKDQCVHRLIDLLEERAGIDKVHIRDEDGRTTSDHSAQLCIHYDPQVISLNRVQTLARQAGADISHRYGHYVGYLNGIRHARHARVVAEQIRDWQGILEASVSASGAVHLEFDQLKTSLATLLKHLKENGTPAQMSEGNVAHTHSSHQHHDHDHSHEGHTHEPSEKHDHAGHSHSAGDGHHHEHGGIFGPNTELIFASLCAVCLGIGYGLSYVTGLPRWVSLVLYGLAYFFGGFFTAKEAIETIRRGQFEIDFLMLVAAAGAGFLGEWAEGALLLALFSIGHALEHYAMGRARKSIAALADLSAKTATVRRNGTTEEIDVADLQIGDVIIVKPNSKLAADGVVVKGSGPVNQAPITGESVPVDKIALADPDADAATAKTENRVFAGTINSTSVLEIRVTKAASDSTLARLIKLVNEAESQQSPTQQFTDRFERWFVPAVLILVGTLCFAFLVIDEPFSASFYRAMAVLVAASPCALAISTPSAVLSGVARAAREGVLVKGGRPLEDLGELTAVAFDKTGTLTQGKPTLNQVITLGGTEEELLTVAIAVEKLSDHPLANAIVQGATEKLGKTSIPEAKNLKALTGRGVQADVNNKPVFIGNKALFEEQKTLTDEVRSKADELESSGHTTMIVRRGDTFLGILGVRDTPRPEAKSTLEALKELGIRRMIMLTGDNQRVADAIAKQVGLTDAFGDLLPEAKVQSVQLLRQQEGKVAMVGDGVNDAPAMAKSTVGIAMGAAGSDVALETADIALMGDKLEKLPFAIGLSRAARRIIRQNLFISLGMVLILIPLTILGVARIGPAVIAHEGSTLVVVFNALRLLAFREKSGK